MKYLFLFLSLILFSDLALASSDMILYDKFCYADSTMAISAMKSSLIGTASGGWFITDIYFGSLGPGELNLWLIYEDISTGVIKNVATVLPRCNAVGTVNSYTGLSLADTVALSGAGLFVLGSAFAMKIIKRAL